MDSYDKICVSIFRNGKNTTDRETYTALWIELLNQLIGKQYVLARKETRI